MKSLDPLTSRQKTIVIALSVAIGLTRLLAVARSLFDWDEALFVLGVRDYDVVYHHPHPPGYPLFMALAKAVHLIGVPEFRSLQAIVVLGAVALFPALFFLARQIGFDFVTAVCGAGIYAFLPNVWVYGGTGFSDVPATALGFAACALLLRGRTDRRAFVLGAIALGLAAGMRPPNLLIGAVPALLATWHQRRAWKTVLLAILLGGAIAAGSYLGAALASESIDRYREAVRSQSKWVREVDSYHNPHRAPLHDLLEVFFLWPVRQQQQMVGLSLFAVISLLAAIAKRRAAPLLTLAIFLPFAVMAWLHLDVETAARYAIPYMATHALLAADGLGIISRRRMGLQAGLCAAVVAVFAVWTWPALTLQRTRDSPPFAALDWIRRNARDGQRVYVNDGIAPLGQVVLPDRPNTTFFQKPEEISPLTGEAWVLDLTVVRDAHNFVWPRTNPLWKIIRRRNFESSVARASSRVVFGSGWHGDEGSFRWMAGESVTTLPALRGSGKLWMRIYVPNDALPSPPTIEVRMNGATVERFIGSGTTIEKSWTVPSRQDAPNELRIITSATVNPLALGTSPDGRDLGLRVDGLSWSPME
ncbi:MAG TPA: hypothetical protein VHL59_10720 [Thermoanaerobaculia bacterium]|nr:hypothetical protein [Thermoanaerobaculia bacterium]